jgi:hypothetical protein
MPRFYTAVPESSLLSYLTKRVSTASGSERLLAQATLATARGTDTGLLASAIKSHAPEAATP